MLKKKFIKFKKERMNKDSNCRIKDLEKIMDKLRSPEGCPWDREQTLESLKPMVVEETFEVLEAVDNKSIENLKEELGDLLLQIVFYSRIAKENNWFTLDDVIENISKKLIRRHPHVFGNERILSSQKVLEQWEEIKSKEKKDEGRNSILDGLPNTLPSVYEAFQISERVKRVGFDWKNIEEVVKKLEEEIMELKSSIKEGKDEKIEEEIGDVFFSLVNVCRFLNRDPEAIFKKGNKKFKNRFKKLETEVKKRNLNFGEMKIEELEDIWQEVKNER